MAMKFIDMTGKTVDEAVSKALAELNLGRDDVSVEILERGKSGFLGLGSVPARCVSPTAWRRRAWSSL